MLRLLSETSLLVSVFSRMTVPNFPENAYCENVLKSARYGFDVISDLSQMIRQNISRNEY